MNEEQYTLIASALKNARPHKKGYGHEYTTAITVWGITVRHMAFYLSRYGINEEKFVTLCGIHDA